MLRQWAGPLVTILIGGGVALILLLNLNLPIYAPELDEYSPDHPRSVLRGLTEFREHLGGELTIALLEGTFFSSSADYPLPAQLESSGPYIAPIPHTPGSPGLADLCGSQERAPDQSIPYANLARLHHKADRRRRPGRR